MVSGPAVRTVEIVPRTELLCNDSILCTRAIRTARDMMGEELFPPPWSEHDGTLRSPWTLAESSVVTAAHSSKGANEARRDGTGGESRKDVK